MCKLELKTNNFKVWMVLYRQACGRDIGFALQIYSGSTYRESLQRLSQERGKTPFTEQQAVLGFSPGDGPELLVLMNPSAGREMCVV